MGGAKPDLYVFNTTKLTLIKINGSLLNVIVLQGKQIQVQFPRTSILALGQVKMDVWWSGGQVKLL